MLNVKLLTADTSHRLVSRIFRCFDMIVLLITLGVLCVGGYLIITDTKDVLDTICFTHQQDVT